MLNAAFDASWMIGLVRLVAIVGGVYLLTSIAVRVGRGQWLNKAGPMEAEVEDALDDRQRLRDDLRRSNDLVDALLELLRHEGVALDPTMADTDRSGGEASPGEVGSDGST